MSDIIYALLIGAFAGSFFTLLGMAAFMVFKQPVEPTTKGMLDKMLDEPFGNDDRA